MLLSLGRLVGALAAASLGSSLLAAPAHGIERHVDAPRDIRVQTLTDSDAPGRPGDTRPTSDREGDVLATRITHGLRSIAVTVRYAALSPRSANAQVLVVHGSNGQQRWVTVDTIERARGGAEMRRVKTDRRACARGLSHRIDYRAGTISVRFPRHCIGSPARVRVAGVLLRMESDDLGYRTHYDDLFRDGGPLDGAGRTFSRWVGR